MSCRKFLFITILIYVSFQAEFSSPIRSPSSGGNDETFEDLGEGMGGGEAEGFICPSCMRGFVAPEELQIHFESQHSSEASLNSAKKNEGHLTDLKGESDEKAHSMRLATFLISYALLFSRYLVFHLKGAEIKADSF